MDELQFEVAETKEQLSMAMETNDQLSSQIASMQGELVKVSEPCCSPLLYSKGEVSVMVPS